MRHNFSITKIAVVTVAASLLASCAYFQPQKTGQANGVEYTVTIKNALRDEKFAPVLIVGSADDSKIWVGDYVSEQARTQFTTGNPGPLAGVLGGDQGQPGSLGVGEDLTFSFRTAAKTARVTAMVHPDKTPDNYVTVLLDLDSKGSFELVRFDIGDDEERKTVEKVGPAGTVTVR